MNSKVISLLAAGGLMASAQGAPEIEQTFSLVRGWNAIRLEVGPKEKAETLFQDWPVSSVSLYDPAAFLVTKQFTSRGTNEGVQKPGYLTWRRDDPGASGFTAVPADSILLCFATSNYTGRITGTPAAPRIAWHQSSTNDTMNLVGISTWADTTAEAYFSGFDLPANACYVFGGADATKPAVMSASLFGGMALADGTVLAVDSSKVGDWSGVLNVSPRSGIDFGTDLSQGVLDIRNDGATARTVSIQLQNVASAESGFPSYSLYAQQFGAGVTNTVWTEFNPTNRSARVESTVPAKATWRVTLALDRSKLAPTAGQAYGAILDIRDEDGGSKMRVRVPIAATTGSADGLAKAWPCGVWVASAVLDTVTFRLTANDEVGVPGTGDVPSGGKMKVRLPISVGPDGDMTLLQRVIYGRTTNGVLRAYTGAVEKFEDPIGEVKRISTPFLPTDQPVLAMTGNFGSAATCPFVVGENSKVNPLRHARHPQHDGLSADYSKAAPSGDNLANYMGTIKPESFSITNRVVFTWDANSAATWNPEEKLTGTLTWEFDGLRHEGTVRAKGKFVMKRVLPVVVK